MKQIKKLRAQETRTRGSFGEPLAGTAQCRAHLLDTCYLRRLAASGYGMYESLKRLRENSKGEIIVTSQVMEEFSRQMKSPSRHVPRAEAAKPLSELYRASREGILKIENCNISDEEMKRLSRLMESTSDKGNSRLGAGEASLFLVAQKLREALSEVSIVSTDSDVPTLIGALGWKDVSVCAEPAA